MWHMAADCARGQGLKSIQMTAVRHVNYLRLLTGLRTVYTSYRDMMSGVWSDLPQEFLEILPNPQPSSSSGDTPEDVSEMDMDINPQTHNLDHTYAGLEGGENYEIRALEDQLQDLSDPSMGTSSTSEAGETDDFEIFEGELSDNSSVE
eukprot:GFYU01014948.1.p2 GENE.GFYU01014948.1~~GFYU01014948.1.p2  ORF type:complete len:149 (+),score=24.08 GFYU01014948.1:2-448(+)